jgi:hypothetical protein
MRCTPNLPQRNLLLSQVRFPPLMHAAIGAQPRIARPQLPGRPAVGLFMSKEPCHVPTDECASARSHA